MGQRGPPNRGASEAPLTPPCPDTPNAGPNRDRPGRSPVDTGDAATVEWSAMRYDRRSRRTMAGCLAVTIVAIAAVYLARVPLATGFGRFLDVGEPPTATDAVFVLGGNLDTRVPAGVKIVRDGFAPRLLLMRVATLGDQPPGEVPQHEQARRLAVALGVAEDRIELIGGGGAVSTADEAAAAGAWLNGHPGSTMTVVTDDFHTRRARWIFARRVAVDRFRMASAHPPNFGPDNWWRDVDGFEVYVNEAIKSAFYRLRYGYAPLVLATAVAGYIAYRFKRGAADADSDADSDVEDAGDPDAPELTATDPSDPETMTTDHAADEAR